MKDPKQTAELARTSLPWPCWIEVDLDAIRHNVQGIRALVGPDCRTMAVVKSQAYGHGAVAVARTALEAGATWLGVARVREAVQLREAGLHAPILLLGPIVEAEVETIVDLALRPTVVDGEQARLISRSAVAAGRAVPVHVKLDTGLGRYGAPFHVVRRLLHDISRLPGLQLEGLYSHFATADDPDGAFARSQLDAFTAAQAALEAEGFHFPLVHMAASAAILGVAGSHMDVVRLGLSLYGLYPSPHLAARLELRPALSLHSRVARVFRLEPGQSVGYGRTFVAARPVVAALIPVGYADGLPRSHSNRGYILVNGRRAPLIGRVSMDQCVVDVTDCGPVQEGDPAVIIGRQADQVIGCDEFAERSGTISYEVLTSLGYRVPRVYRIGGAIRQVAYLDEGRLEDWSG